MLLSIHVGIHVVKTHPFYRFYKLRNLNFNKINIRGAPLIILLVDGPTNYNLILNGSWHIKSLFIF